MKSRFVLLSGILCISSLLIPLSSPGQSVAASGSIDFEPYPPIPSVSPSAGLVRADELFAGLAEESPQAYTGVALDPGRNELVVSLPGGTDVATRESAVLQKLERAKIPGVAVRFNRIKYNYEAIEQAWDNLNDLVDQKTYQGQLLGLGLKPSRGVVVVYATEGSEAMRTTLKTTYDDMIIFRRADQMAPLEFNRDRDTSPHFGGARYGFWTTSNNDYFNLPNGNFTYCSTGFAVEIDGVEYMLTAGHCRPGGTNYPKAWASAFRNVIGLDDTYYFGTLLTTTLSGEQELPVDGSQDLYGDWALITKNSSYGPSVYNGPPVGVSTYLHVDSARWQSPSENSEWCSSGRTTGQRCRIFVEEPEFTWDFAIYVTRKMFTARSNQTGGDVDCGGPTHGDSGGAVYRGTGVAGQIQVVGNVTSGTPPPNCLYGFSKIQGLQSWNPAVRVLFD